MRQQGLSVSVEHLCKESPHLVPAVRQELDALDQMDRVLDSREDSGTGKASSAAKTGMREGTTTATLNYQIERLVAFGGCSEVYVASDQELSRRVAIKFLRPDTEHLEVYRRRLQREAEITSQLNHPGVVSIHSIGTDSRDLPFYTMRLVEGESLATAIEQFHRESSGQRLPFSSATGRKLLNHFRDVCQTIAFAHSKEVLHRDIKPSNIVIGSFGETYLIDWGLARYLNSPESDQDVSDDGVADHNADTVDSPRLTRLGTALGSPAYMSPEQATGAETGNPSDIFNLGATLYALLTGEPPYSSSSLIQTIRDAERGAFVSAAKRNTHVPAPLDAICSRAMQVEKADRYESAERLASDIDRFLADEPVLAMREPRLEKVRRWIKRRKTLVTTVATSAAIALILLAIGNAVLLDSNRKLATREAEAVRLKEGMATALDKTRQSLYSQRIALAHAEWLKSNPHRALQILNECPESLRQWEWHHLHWLVTRHRPRFTEQGTGESIYAFEFSPENGWLAYGDSNGVIQLWNPETGAKSKTIETGISIRAMAFGPDARLLAVTGNIPNYNVAVIQVWNIDDGVQVSERKSRGAGSFLTACWSSDGSLIATGSSSGGIRIRDSKTLVPTTRIAGHSGGVRHVMFRPDSNHLVSGGDDGHLRIWNLDGGKVSDRQLHPRGLTGFTSLEQTVVTCGNDELVRIWKRPEQDPLELVTKSETGILVGHTDRIQTVAMSPDGKYVASAGLDRSIRVWDSENGEEVAVVRQHSSHVRRVAFDPSGKYLVSSGDDNRINVWNVRTVIQPIPRGQSVGFSRDAHRLFVGSYESISVWQPDDMSPDFRIHDHPKKLLMLISSPTEPVAASFCFGGEVLVWNTVSGEKLHLLHENKSPAYSGVFSQDGKTLFVAYHNGLINAYQVDSGKVTKSTRTSHIVYRLAITHDGNQLVSAHRNGSLQYWSTEDLSEIREVQAHDGILLDLASNPVRNEISTTGQNGEICVWNPETGQRLLRIDVGASWLNCLEYTPDGNRLVSGSEHTVTFWDSMTGHEVLSLSLDRCVHSMAFSSDGRFLAIGGEDPRVRVWRADSARQLSAQ